MAKSTRAGAARPPLVALRHREGVGCGWRGREFPADAEGIVLVPAEAVAELVAHGFVAVGGEEAVG
ncbi:MAG TPA: hypothetical protein VGR91_17330 [Stellaceae bacterium]|nr:hypothetical protein [Stellaceae bacterium]